MENYTFEEIKHKLEYYCSYQDRCHKEVEQKLNSFTLITALKEKVIVHLIENNFINEERFAQSFVRGKHNYKFWGKNRYNRLGHMSPLPNSEISRLRGLLDTFEKNAEKGLEDLVLNGWRDAGAGICDLDDRDPS